MEGMIGWFILLLVIGTGIIFGLLYFASILVMKIIDKLEDR